MRTPILTTYLAISWHGKIVNKLMQKDSLFLPIITDNTPNLNFIRANTALLAQHVTVFNSLQTSLEKEELLEKLWDTEYSAKLIRNTDKYIGIRFNSSTSLSMFLLKWS